MPILNLSFSHNPQRPLNILCIGAHADDIEIGCGGAILRLARQFDDLHCKWIVFSSDERRRKEAKASAEQFLSEYTEKRILIEDFRDGFFPYHGGDIKEYFEGLKRDPQPDLIFTHNRHDLHQDHRLLYELTWNTFREHLILEYEIPKYDGDFGSPNVFVELDEEISSQKVKILLTTFESQLSKHWFTEDLLMSVMRIRGMESGGSSKLAEAFYCKKLLF
jgi:LmbE family N-acetylglucosaminyl deacetylase